MESAIFEVEMWRQEKTHAKTFDYLDSHTRHVLTFLNMDNEEDAMRKLLRYQAAARRAYNAAFKQLQVLQGDRFDRQPSSLPRAHPGISRNRAATRAGTTNQRSQSSGLYSPQHEITERTRALAPTRSVHTTHYVRMTH